MLQSDDYFGFFTSPAKKAQREARAIARMERWAEDISEDPLQAYKAWDKERDFAYWFGVVVGIVITVVTLWHLL